MTRALFRGGHTPRLYVLGLWLAIGLGLRLRDSVGLSLDLETMAVLMLDRLVWSHKNLPGLCPSVAERVQEVWEGGTESREK